LEEDGPELIKTQAGNSKKGRQACDHLEKKHFWRLRREGEETSEHFGKLFLLSKSAVKLRLTLIAISYGLENCVFPAAF